MENKTFVQAVLQNHFNEIKARNPSYSIRGFAKKVGVTPGTLSLVMLGKRPVSKKMAEKIADSLMLDPQERAQILDHYLQSKPKVNVEEYLKLSTDQFQIVGEWQHFAILNLIKTKNFESDVNWISERLGLSAKKTEESIERLLRLGLMTQDKNGNFKRAKSKYRTPDNIANLSLRKSHHETLDLAHESLDRHSVDERDFTWVSFAFDPERMTEAKALIRKFQDDFLDLVQDKANLTEVYRMSVQLFPLTQLNQEKKNEK